MAKLGQRALNTLSTVLDMLIVVVSMAIAFCLRFYVFEGEGPLGSLLDHIMWATAFSPVYVFFYGLLGVYDRRSSEDTTHALGRLIAGNTLATMLFIDCIFVFRMVDFSRWLIVMFWLLTVAFSCTKLVVVNRRVQARHRRGLDQRRVVIVGSGSAAREYGEAVGSEQGGELVLLGSIGSAPLAEGVEHLGGCDRLEDVLEACRPDEIVVALDPLEQRNLGNVLLSCKASGSRVAVLPSYHQYLSRRPNVSIEGGLPLINVSHVALDNMGFAFAKRAVDVVGSIARIVLTSPVMLAAAVGTRLSSPGPVIFKQLRVGRGRRTFYMYKFRSMRVNDEQDSAWTTDGDPRRTRFGAFMRHYSIDELPQLFNVLRGDMSLVGPRPELPQHVEHFRCSVPLYMVRHQVRPGITGWAQVNGLRGDTSIEERVKYDLYYIENWSLLFDLRILLLTPARGVVNKQESLIGRP